MKNISTTILALSLTVLSFNANAHDVTKTDTVQIKKIDTTTNQEDDMMLNGMNNSMKTTETIKVEKKS